MIETKNAVIRSVRLGPEDHGILTAWLDLDYGGVCQEFGGWNLQATGENYCGHFIKRCLEVIGARDWNELPGKTIRVTHEHTKVHRIGHIIEDKWFDPSADFAQIETRKKEAA